MILWPAKLPALNYIDATRMVAFHQKGKSTDAIRKYNVPLGTAGASHTAGDTSVFQEEQGSGEIFNDAVFQEEGAVSVIQEEIKGSPSHASEDSCHTVPGA